MRSYARTVCVLFCCSLCGIDGLKILGLFSGTSHSHHIFLERFVEHLVDKGHSLTVVSPHTGGSKKWRHIEIDGFATHRKETRDLAGLEDFKIPEKLFPFLLWIYYPKIAKHSCEKISSNPDVQNLVITKEKFDAILVEQHLGDCCFGIAHLLDAPVVAVQTSGLLPWNHAHAGQPNEPAYMPALFLQLSRRMSFLERVENYIHVALFTFLHPLLFLKPEREILERNFNATLPPLENILRNTSAILINTHFSLSGAVPLVPGIIEVGGLHVQAKAVALDPELEKFMNESENGVVLFSMGSMIKATSLPPLKLDAILTTLGGLRQNVIWKWEGEKPNGLPSNVYIMKWVPQYEILHHPKTVAFMSHGGMLGTTEAVHAGVPVVFIPVFGDQHTNAAAGEEAGLGVKVPFTSLTADKLQDALNKVLSPEMRASAKSLSAEWRDRPSPLQVATDAVEYVARHGGKRLRSAALDLQPYQLMLLDVYAFLAAILTTIVFAIIKIGQCCLGLCFGKKNLQGTQNRTKLKTN